MSDHNEMTRYAFISHMEDYMKKLLTAPLKADTDEFLKSHGIDGPKALQILTMRADPDDENSSIVVKSAKIKDNGYDEEGKRNKDSFIVKYKIPRKDYTKKMRNLFISLFERHLTDNPVLEEGAWGYGILDNDAALDYQSKTTGAYIKKVMNDIMMAGNSDDKWAKVGVLIDFLKKYKSDELQVTDEYTNAIEFTKSVLKGLMSDQAFISSWDDEKKIKSSLKKAFSDVAALKYNEDIMLSSDQIPVPMSNGRNVTPIRGDGRLMEDLVQEEDCAGATTAEASSGAYDAVSFPMVRKKTMYITQEQAKMLGKMINEEEAMAGMAGAPTTQTTGDYQYTVPMGRKNKFYGEAMDHKNIMAKSWKGSMEEERSTIHIKEKNKGKFNATKARTGKSTEELTHSKNPITRKRANFARMAKRGWKPLD